MFVASVRCKFSDGDSIHERKHTITAKSTRKSTGSRLFKVYLFVEVAQFLVANFAALDDDLIYMCREESN